MEKEWIQFVLCNAPTERKTKIWYVAPTAGGSVLGQVKFYGAWRKYCFYPKEEAETVFDAACLRLIANFCETHTEEWRKSLA